MLTITCTNENSEEMRQCARILLELADAGVIAYQEAGVSGFGVATPAPTVGDIVAGVTEELPNAATVFGGNGETPEQIAARIAADAGRTAELLQNGYVQTAPATVPSNLVADTSVGTAVPPPPPAANTAAVPPPPPAAGPALELDAAGLPWDGRIHASTKTRVKASDTWKKKKGVEAGLVQTVEAELRTRIASAPAPVAAAPASTGAVVPPPPATTATPVNPSNVTELMTALVPYTQSGALAPARINALCAELGVPMLGAIVSRPDLVAPLWDKIKAELRI